MAIPNRISTLPPARVYDGKHWRIRPLKRGDRELVFALLAQDGWEVPFHEQEVVTSWVVQHPELETFVAHDAASFSRILGLITLSHRPQLRLGGRVASVDLFVVAPEHRGKGIGHDLLLQAMRRAETLGCKRMEMFLPKERDDRHAFFEGHEFQKSDHDLYVRRLR